MGHRCKLLPNLTHRDSVSASEMPKSRARHRLPFPTCPVPSLQTPLKVPQTELKCQTPFQALSLLPTHLESPHEPGPRRAKEAALRTSLSSPARPSLQSSRNALARSLHGAGAPKGAGLHPTQNFPFALLQNSSLTVTHTHTHTP